MAATNRINQLQFWNDMFREHPQLYTKILHLLASSDADNDKLLGWFILQADQETFRARLEGQDEPIAAAIQSICQNNAHIEQLWIQKLAEWKREFPQDTEIAKLYWPVRLLEHIANRRPMPISTYVTGPIPRPSESENEGGSGTVSIPLSKRKYTPRRPKGGGSRSDGASGSSDLPGLVASDDEEQEPKRGRGRPMGAALGHSREHLTHDETYAAFMSTISNHGDELYTPEDQPHNQRYQLFEASSFKPEDATFHIPGAPITDPYVHGSGAAGNGQGYGGASHGHGEGGGLLTTQQIFGDEAPYSGGFRFDEEDQSESDPWRQGHGI